MKTKTLFIKLLLTALLMIAFFSCKNSSVSNKNKNNKSGKLNRTWVNTSQDSVNGNIIKFVVSPNTITSSASPSYSSTFVYSFGEIIFKGSPYAVVSPYKNCNGYKYGPGWQAVNTGNVVLTLQNGNTKFIIDYPGISASFSKIIYEFQKQ